MNQRREIKDGILYFDGCSTVDLAKQYGTPLYVMSEGDIEDKMREIKTCFLDKYPNTRAAYASKAFCTMAIYKICEKEGFCIDIVSGGELHTAIKAGFPAERIEFNGNNKLPQEIEDPAGRGCFLPTGGSSDQGGAHQLFGSALPCRLSAVRQCAVFAGAGHHS